MAAKDVNDLPRNERDRIIRKVKEFAETGRGDVKKLQGHSNEFRLRVGDWRVRFSVDNLGHLIILTVLRVLPRGSAYKE